MRLRWVTREKGYKNDHVDWHTDTERVLQYEIAVLDCNANHVDEMWVDVPEEDEK